VTSLPDDALAAFNAWFDDAKRDEPDVPDAMQLATVGPEGRPSLRTVLLKDVDARGFVFYTNLGSRKSSELRGNPAATALFHWKSAARQAIAEGDVAPVSDAEADAYFATRPRGSQIGAWASRQSAPLAGRAALEAEVAAFEARFAGSDVPRPPHWSGWRLAPRRVELWQGQPDRLHERRVWEWVDGRWTFGLRYP
jgi:pyridoxamine 5'-phosphate oxidase